MTEVNINLLQQQLMDIYQPDSVSWWPLAPAWWLLILVIILFGLFISYLYYQKTALRRLAIKQLELIEDSFLKQGNINQLAMSLNIILRRVVLSHKTLHCSPGLTGIEWLNYLDQQNNGQEFSLGIGQQLFYLPYKQTSTASADDIELGLQLIILVKQWITKNT